jgi:glutamine synthetase
MKEINLTSLVNSHSVMTMVPTINKSIDGILQYCSENGIQFIDVKSVDLCGRLRHVSLPVSEVSEKSLSDGIGFDGSGYGFLEVESSDLVEIPDLATVLVDPFRQATTLSLFANIHLTDSKRTRFELDPRYICNKAELLLKRLEIADDLLVGPEYEFYLFASVEFSTTENSSYYSIDYVEDFEWNTYHAANPFDKYDDFRDEATQLMKSLGIATKYHHHEAGRKGQQEIETTFNPLLETADQSVLIRYLLYNLAEKHNMRLTFMPKPIYGEAGSGWHIHQFLTKNGKNIFYDENGPASLSEVGLYYIGGLLKHAPSLCAFTNPSTNSYKRLLPGFEAPTVMTFGRSNRSAAVRIPSYVSDPQELRFEYRPPDGTANPYLALSAMLLAGIDGIQNQYDPIAEGLGPSEQRNAGDLKKVEFLPQTLDDALDALQKDHEYLLRDKVFDNMLIERWIGIKRREASAIAARPHPFEFPLYFQI